MTDAPYHHGDLPRALLVAVDEIVAEEGVGAVSLRAVARRAGVSHAAPAHHFGDRGGLLAAYAADGYRRFTTGIREARTALPEGATAADALTAMGYGYVAFGLAEPGRYNVMFRPELVDCADPQLVEEGGGAYAALIAMCRACLAPQTPDDDVVGVAISAWATVHGFVSLALDSPQSEVDHLPEVAPLLDRVMATFLAGLRANPLWVGDDVPASAIPADLSDPLVSDTLAS